MSRPKKLVFLFLIVQLLLSTGTIAMAEESAAQQPPEASARTRADALQPGDCIAIVGPASHSDGQAFPEEIAYLHSLGYRTKLLPSATAVCGYLAGSDSLRAEDINHAFLDDEVKAILCIRGGYGSGRILDRLDYAGIAAHPKMLIGFSDITALHTALGERSHLVTIHAPMLTTLLASEYSARQLREGLAGSQPLGNIAMPAGQTLQSVIPGQAEGILIGGNLTVLASLMGTPYAPKGDGALLFLEEVGEGSYRIDRMMNQLLQGGLLQRVSGIIFGEFKNCPCDPGDFTTEEVLAHYARLSGKPAIKGLPAGHGVNNMFLPLGVHAVLHADSSGQASLVIDGAYAADRRHTAKESN